MSVKTPHKKVPLWAKAVLAIWAVLIVGGLVVGIVLAPDVMAMIGAVALAFGFIVLTMSALEQL